MKLNITTRKYYNEESAYTQKELLELEGCKVKVDESIGVFSREHTWVLTIERFVDDIPSYLRQVKQEAAPLIGGFFFIWGAGLTQLTSFTFHVVNIQSITAFTAYGDIKYLSV